MQTLTLNVQDDLLADVIGLLTDRFKDSVEIFRDKNLALDPYYYERKKHLKAIRNDIQNGKAEMLSEAEFESRVETFMGDLERKYAHPSAQ